MENATFLIYTDTDVRTKIGALRKSGERAIAYLPGGQPVVFILPYGDLEYLELSCTRTVGISTVRFLGINRVIGSPIQHDCCVTYIGKPVLTIVRFVVGYPILRQKLGVRLQQKGTKTMVLVPDLHFKEKVHV